MTGAWIAQTLQAFFKWLSKLSDWAGKHPSSARILIYVLGIVLIVLLAHIAYTVIGEFLSLRKRNAETDVRYRTLPALEGVAENWSDAFVLAKAALQSGDLYRAMWITHRILLSVLDLREMVKFTRWKTNSDYIRECRAGDPAAATLREITAAYERVVYAHGDFDREQAARLVEQVEAFAGKEVR
ncbi:MAG TPA: DUF4129 domain-containing protein [Burkholderiales bacterium]|nr:DUF4129 domain-containing protein [Burkholderiales bacterium]